MLPAAFLSKTVQRYDNFLKYQTNSCIFLLCFAAKGYQSFLKDSYKIPKRSATAIILTLPQRKAAVDFLPGFKVLFRKNVAYIVAGEQSAGGGCEFAGAVAVGAPN